jgi:membrane-associated phospholipid phosphatase
MKPDIRRWAGTGLWIAVLWVAWVLSQAPYLVMRGAGDNLSSPHGIEGIERRLFLGVVPTRFLQAHLYDHGSEWLDYASFLAHGFWFGIPFAAGIVIMRYERTKLLEYFWWQFVLFQAAATVFLFLPVRPPWMEDGVVRILLVRNYGDYADIDNNPFAAFPSMHAGLPFLTALFFFQRLDRKLRFFAWLFAAFTVAVSFAIVYMGEHWVLDVLGGYAAAALTAWLCTSRRMHRLYGRIPGEPVGRLTRLNERMCAPGTEPAAEPQPHALPEPLREAA